MHDASLHMRSDTTPMLPTDLLKSSRSSEEVAAEPIQPRSGAGVVWSSRTSTLTGFQVLGVSAALPERIVTNEDLQRDFGFDPAWIEQRTGILARRYAVPGQATSDLCIQAAKGAMATANVTPNDIDLVIVATFTPDYLCPSTANLVQAALEIEAPAMDLAAACSGFTYALVTASQFVATGNSRCALVIGGDCNSRIVNPKDLKIAPLFGDGAGAVILGKGASSQGLISYQLGSDGSGAKMLERPAGGTACPLTPTISSDETYLQMDGRNVFKWAVRAVADSIRTVLERAQVAVEDVAVFVLHQANIRIISKVAETLGIPADRLYNNLDRYGNTSAGSIPIALSEVCADGRICRGDLVLMCGFGAGLTWGTCLIRW